MSAVSHGLAAAGARSSARIGIIDPIGDGGIGGYVHELAEGLVANCMRVTVFGEAPPLPRGTTIRYERRTLTGAVPSEVGRPAPPPVPPDRAALAPYFDLLDARASRPPQRRAPLESQPELAPTSTVAREAPVPAAPRSSRPTDAARASAHASALAESLRRDAYDLVWTQWPQLVGADAGFRARCRRAGLPLVHTVHNVLPHERMEGDVAIYGAAYRASGALIVHTAHAEHELAQRFPRERDKIIQSRHGLYTTFPRVPLVRNLVRERLALDDDTIAVLLFGGVRPYKNVDVLLAALRMLGRTEDVVLVVAGVEWGYPHLYAHDRLGNTRGLAARCGVLDRVRLLPGPFGSRQSAELFEASDVVAAPYTGSSGSGVLSLGMSFGRHVLTTAESGPSSSLDGYPAATISPTLDAAALADALLRAAAAVRRAGFAETAPPSSLAWPRVAASMLRALREKGILA
jgi:glycosyltransferase involved in cell wall biosynthesis